MHNHLYRGDLETSFQGLEGLFQKDKEGFLPFDLLKSTIRIPSTTNKIHSLWTWGSDTTIHVTKSPEPLFFAHTLDISISKYHLMTLVDDKLLVHGFGKALGLDLQTARKPTFLMDKVGIISAGHNHSLAICGDTLVGWGDNEYFAVGHSNGAPAVVFKKALVGCAAGKYHSCCWSSNSIYSWGI
jgi:hypothetical protein